MKSLTEAKTGERYTIKWMICNRRVAELMRRFGIEEGSDIDVRQKGKWGLLIGKGERRFVIGSEVAACIRI